MKNSNELFVIGAFAAFAVALILYQHAVHTGQILDAVTTAPDNSAIDTSTLASASLAGSPAPGQSNLIPEQLQATPLTIEPGYYLH